MARSYDAVTADRRERGNSKLAATTTQFERSYEIAVQVLELREQRGFTQAELAARCGVTQADISRIERGSTSPTARVLSRIADALEADVRLVTRVP